MLQSVKVVEEQEKQKQLELEQKEFGKVNIVKGALENVNSASSSNSNYLSMKESGSKEVLKRGKLMKGSAFDSYSQASFSKVKVGLCRIKRI